MKPTIAALSLASLLLTVPLARADDAEAWSHLDQAQAYLSTGQAKAALISMKNAAKAAPDNPQVRLELGRTYLRLGSPDAAAKELRKAADLGSPRAQVTPPLAEALSKGGKYPQVIELLADDDTPSPHVRILRADAYFNTGSTDKARTDYLAALDSDPEMIAALLGLARLESVQEQPQQAFAWVRRALAAQPDAAAVWSLLGDLEVKNKHRGKALSAYQTALRLAPQATDIRLRVAAIQLELGQTDSARKTIASLRSSNPDNPIVQLLDATLNLRAGDLQQATDTLNRLTAHYPDNPQALFLLGQALLQQKEYERAISVLQSYRSQRPTDPNGARLLGTAHARGGSLKSAEQLLLPLLESAPRDQQALEALRVAYTRAGALDQAVNYEKRLAELTQGREQLSEALAFVKQGRRDEALTLLEQTAGLYPQFYQAKLLQYRELVRAKQFGDAVEVAQAMQALLPESAQPKLLLGIALAGKGDFSAARDAIEAAWKISPGAPEVGHRLALLQLLNKDNAKAIATYQAVLKAHPGDATTLIRMAVMSARLGDDKAKLDYLRQAVDATPGELRPRQLLAAALVKKGDIAQALAEMLEVKQRFGDDPSYVQRVMQLQLAQKDWSAAIDSGRQLVEFRPQSALPHLHLAEAYGKAGDLPKLSSEMDSALSLPGDTGLSSRQLIQLAALTGDQQGARQLLEQLLSRHPDNSELAAVLINMAVSAQRWDDALALIDDMRHRSPDEVRWTIAKIRTQYRAADIAGATRSLERAQQRFHDAPELKMLAASLALHNRDNSAAIKRYQDVIQQQPKNVAALNNLAWLMRDTDPDTALDYAKRAATLSRHPQILDTYGIVLLSNNKPQLAVKVLRIAVAGNGDNVEIQYHLATALVASGNPGEARALLQTILTGDTPFDSRPQAQALLDTMQAKKP